MSDSDRPKKSWREIDQQRDGSSHRKDPQGPSPARQERLERSAAYRNYKTQLNRLFDGGALPETLKEKLADAGVGADAKRRKEDAERIAAATSTRDVLAALETYRAAHGFPESENALSRLLEVEDESVVLETIEAIGRLHAEGRLKRGASLKGRLRTAMMTLDEPEIQSAGKKLLDVL